MSCIYPRAIAVGWSGDVEAGDESFRRSRHHHYRYGVPVRAVLVLMFKTFKSMLIVLERNTAGHRRRGAGVADHRQPAAPLWR